MGARNGEQYLKALASTSREIWLGGERVDSVVDHPQFAQAARAMARWFDLQFEHSDELLVPDEETGEHINASHMIPRSRDDLDRRHVALRRISELSMGVMGRLPDYLNVTFAGFAGSPSDWRGADGSNEIGAYNLLEFQKRLRRQDLAATHTIVHPTTDKARTGFVDDPVPLHKVGETKDSIIVRGARVLATLAPFAEEQTIYPGAPLPADASPEYALSFSVRMDTPGLVFICRDSASRPGTAPIDAPFSAQFDEQDAYCIFDDVEIPRSDVWNDGDIDIYNSVTTRSAWRPNVMQQTTIRALTKLEFAYGLANRMAEVINDKTPETQEMLGELVCYIESVRNGLIAAEERCAPSRDGAVFPDIRALHPLRALLTSWFPRVNEILRAIGSHNLLAVASHDQLADQRLRPLLDEFLTGAEGIGAQERTEVFRAAWDFVGSAFGSRNDLYERYYLGSRRTALTAIQRTAGVNKERGKELLDKLLADARARS